MINTLGLQINSNNFDSIKRKKLYYQITYNFDKGLSISSVSMSPSIDSNLHSELSSQPRRFILSKEFPKFSNFLNQSKNLKMSEEGKLWELQKGSVTMFVGEVVGTGILIFVGCMGCIGTMGRSPPPPMQMAFTFGLTVNMVIMMLGHVSGAHLNPAVTIGSVIVGLKTIPTGFIYCLGQVIGAIIGYGLLKMVTPVNLFSDGYPDSTVPLCVTVIHPDVTKVQAILIEALCTAMILCTACATWDPRCSHTTDSTAIRFGLAVAGISFAASPYTGCSMNPARTFGPALWTGAWEDQWVYWVGPILGALLGTYTYKVFFNPPDDETEKSKFNRMELSVIDEKTDFIESP